MFACGVLVSGFLYFVYPAPDARQGTSYSPGEFVPSLFIASGWGFVVPEDYNAPELAPFLRREATRFDPDTLPPDLAVTAPFSWDQRHRYLYYAGALIWMVFGISWTAMKLLPVLLYGAMWPLLFRIFRLAGGRRLSAAFTALFMLSPSIIELHWTVRDFSKAPFFLAVILIIGMMVQRRMTAKRLIGLALLAGLIAGIGVGFRRDLVMSMLPALAAVIMAPRMITPRPWITKAAAATVMFGAFALAGAPIHSAYTGVGDPHDAVMGFSRLVDSGLGVKQADYQQMSVQSDFQVHATMVSGARRADGEIVGRYVRPEQISAAGMDLVQWLVLTYPADVVTRALASARWALSGGIPIIQIPAWFVSLIGIALPAITLFIVGSASLRRGLALTLVAAPLFTYIALQFGLRHGFHLTFAPMWCTLFLYTQWVLYRRYRRARGIRPDAAIPAPAYLRRDGQLRGVLILAITACLLFTPLVAARAIQHHNVSALVARYLEAERAPIPTIPRPIGADWTLFAVDPDLPDPDVPYNLVDWPFREAYFVAVFTPSETFTTGLMKYESDDVTLDFTFPFLLPETAEEDGLIYYFFPVYENWHMDGGAWSRFSGVVMPNETAHRFQGLYRLQDPAQFRFWSIYRIQENASDFEYARRIALIEMEPYRYIAPPVEVPTWLLGIDRSMGEFDGMNRVMNTLPAVRAGLEADPLDPALWVWLGNIQEHMGEYEEAVNAYLQAIELLPRHLAGYRHLENLGNSIWDSDERIAVWEGLAQRYADILYPHLALSRALQEAGEPAMAIEAARRALDAAPSRREPYALINSILRGARMTDDALALWEGISADHPDQWYAWHFLARHYRDVERSFQAAVEAFGTAIDLNPDALESRLDYAYTLQNLGRMDEALHEIEEYSRRGGYPNQTYIALATVYRAKGDMDTARDFARKAKESGAQLPASVQVLLD